MAEIKLGRAEAIRYVSEDGAPLIAWLLLPPEFEPGNRPIPMVTIVYPGTVHTTSQPTSLSLITNGFYLHPQLFAASGYAVLLPSMPAPAIGSHSLSLLTKGVLPAVDEVIARGIADAKQIAVVGHSGGGFATLGLITQTNRFRSAVASASYSNMVSLYGTFYGQYRDGDAGDPQAAQVLRMLMLEKGFMGLGGPPWQAMERYEKASPILQVDKVQTPVMIVHGDRDFIPIQQAEEFFTALYRQGKRSVLVRYHGEGHGILNRANVLDFWERFRWWMAETMNSQN